MVLTLENFEERIHAIILDRGKEYLLRDMVESLEQTENGWKATVKSESSGAYQVRLFGKETFEDWDCTCPFDHGPVCKHIAAVLYDIQQIDTYEQEEIQMTSDHIEQLDQAGKLALLHEAITQVPELRQFILKRFYKTIPEEEAGDS